MPEPKRPLKVFLCHASADKPKVRELYRYLRRRGIQPWLDAEDLVGGQDWRQEIPKAIRASEAIIICLSKNSINKEGYVQAEITFALEKALEIPSGRIFIIPARFEDCEVPHSLERFHWVDLFEQDGFPRLMKSLKTRATQLERATVQVPQPDESSPDLTSASKEKAVLESPEHEAAEKAIRQKAKRDATEKLKRERAERRTAQLALLKEASSKYVTALKSGLPKVMSFLRIAGFAGIAIALFWLGSWGAPKLFSLIPTAKPSLAPTTRPSVTVTFTLSPLLPTKTLESSATSTKEFTTTPTPLPTKIIDAKGVEMALVPAGEFMMGAAFGTGEASPIHTVYLDDFYIDIYEVTNALYKACVEASGCTPLPQAIANTYDNYPVIKVDWEQSQDYCEWRGGSLPTEAQWEKAARGTDGWDYPWGNQFDERHLNFCDKNCLADWRDHNSDDGYGGTAPVGSYESGKSPSGIYDLAGNVWEWVADWYSETYYQNSPASNPVGPNSGLYRVIRGASWLSINVAGEIGSANRGRLTPNRIANDVGFRCASSVP